MKMDTILAVGCNDCKVYMIMLEAAPLATHYIHLESPIHSMHLIGDELILCGQMNGFLDTISSTEQLKRVKLATRRTYDISKTDENSVYAVAS